MTPLENMDDDDKLAYKLFVKKKRIEMAVVETALDMAKRQRSIEVAKKLLAANSSIEFIVEITGLLEDDVLCLIAGKDPDKDEE